MPVATRTQHTQHPTSTDKHIQGDNFEHSFKGVQLDKANPSDMAELHLEESVSIDAKNEYAELY